MFLFIFAQIKFKEISYDKRCFALTVVFASAPLPPSVLYQWAALHCSSSELEAETLTILVSCICVGCFGFELPLQVS